jgi:hypothetical protein
MRSENTGSRVHIKYIGSMNNSGPRQRGVSLGCLNALVCITFKEEMHKFLAASSGKQK